MVEIMDSNPAGQIRIKPLCSNCDGLEEETSDAADEVEPVKERKAESLA